MTCHASRTSNVTSGVGSSTDHGPSPMIGTAEEGSLLSSMIRKERCDILTSRLPVYSHTQHYAVAAAPQRIFFFFFLPTFFCFGVSVGKKDGAGWLLRPSLLT